MRKPYPKYKQSALAWLPEVPEHWEEVRYKSLFREINERSEKGEEDLLSVSQYTGVTLRKDNIEEEKENLTNASSLEGYKKVQPNDLVINIMLAWNGSLGISPMQGIVSPAYCVYRGNGRISPKYYHYLLRTDFSKGDFKKVSTGVVDSRLRMYTDDFFKLYTFLPPLPEQTQIATFLDHKCAQIDTAIQKKTRLIELLKEQKQAIINRAVTRGLDPKVPMKDSGIEWLGEVPAHWEVKKLRYLGQCQNGISESAEYFGVGHPFVSYIDVYKNWALPNEVSGLANSSIVEREKFSVLTGDVFFTRTSETIEDIGLTSTCMNTIENATFAGFLIRFRPKKNILETGFSKFYFRSNLVREFLVREINIVIRASLSQELLKRLPVLLPPPSEQRKIVDFIFQESKTIDTTITRIEREIELIKEYKIALIAEAVTGKIDVRDWKPDSKTENQVEHAANL